MLLPLCLLRPKIALLLIMAVVGTMAMITMKGFARNIGTTAASASSRLCSQPLFTNPSQHLQLQLHNRSQLPSPTLKHLLIRRSSHLGIRRPLPTTRPLPQPQFIPQVTQSLQQLAFAMGRTIPHIVLSARQLHGRQPPRHRSLKKWSKSQSQQQSQRPYMSRQQTWKLRR